MASGSGGGVHGPVDRGRQTTCRPVPDRDAWRGLPRVAQEDIRRTRSPHTAAPRRSGEPCAHPRPPGCVPQPGTQPPNRTCVELGIHTPRHRGCERCPSELPVACRHTPVALRRRYTGRRPQHSRPAPGPGVPTAWHHDEAECDGGLTGSASRPDRRRRDAPCMPCVQKPRRRRAMPQRGGQCRITAAIWPSLAHLRRSAADVSFTYPAASRPCAPA